MDDRRVRSAPLPPPAFFNPKGNLWIFFSQGFDIRSKNELLAKERAEFIKLLQRRNQKLLEEAPSHALTPDLRKARVCCCIIQSNSSSNLIRQLQQVCYMRLLANYAKNHEEEDDLS
ncbi:unnamed protein product [Lactuca saligna]|uniref:Uncharacterized protein n=1 Tax=Lactuca saligna TaxID=75948 RepID=A0AA36EKF9_LACSI|nr:unnamed protein product [Lactuca saligna]